MRSLSSSASRDLPLQRVSLFPCFHCLMDVPFLSIYLPLHYAIATGFRVLDWWDAVDMHTSCLKCVFKLCMVTVMWQAL